ncbi:hypothetical protein [Zavarzinella formosa]|uniref:hypothetical protein n=1 Tax=Zavarzinella formosa TaxID=360055 RepID=UPI000303FE36|nr:hypothetical protein [Zavarzinella formosa]
MLLKVPIVTGQEAYTVVRSAVGHVVQRVAICEAHLGGEVVRVVEMDDEGGTYEDAIRHLTSGEVFDEPDEAGFIAQCLNQLTEKGRQDDDAPDHVTQRAKPVIPPLADRIRA